VLAAHGENGDPRPLAGLHVLVVEDAADTLELISTVLEERGARVTCAKSAEAALAATDAETPDVVLSDIGMPGTDGYSFIGRLRAKPRLKAVPAAALTAYARVEDRQRSLRAGYQMHVIKPVEPAELVATVAALAHRATTDPYVVTP
jgi:CheY-like chemotaxis protein